MAFWLVAVTTVSLLATMTILYVQRAAIIRERQLETLTVVRDLTARELDNWLRERRNDLEIEARDFEIRELGETYGRARTGGLPPDEDVTRAARQLLRSYAESYAVYHELFLVSAEDGRIVVSSDEGDEGREEKDEPYFVEALRGGAFRAGEVYYSETARHLEMHFSCPVRCRAHGGAHLVGILVAVLDPEIVLSPILSDYTGLGETGEALLVDKGVLALNTLRWRPSSPMGVKITAEPAVRAARGETGSIETRDYRGVEVLAAYSSIPMTGWGLVVKRDLSEVLAPVDAMFHSMVLVLLFTVTAVVLASFVLAGSIAGPISRIVATMKRFSGGDLEARHEVEGVDEVAALGEAFNSMSASLAARTRVQRANLEVARSILSAGNLHEFAESMILRLVRISGSQVAAFYLRSDDGASFTCVASHGLTAGALPRFSAEQYEGELAMALRTRELSIIRDIPENTPFVFPMTVGTVLPREIVTVPLVVDGGVAAVLSLGTLGSYRDDDLDILRQAQPGMATALSKIVLDSKTRELGEALSVRNEELAAVNEELREQTEELQEQTEELQEQALELESRRAQVEEANRLKSEFLSNMSHELRTPLNSVLALSQLMLARGVGKQAEEDAEHLRVIERNGRALLAQINDILDLSKIESGHMELAPTDFDARDLVNRVVETVKPIVAAKGLSLQVDLDSAPRMHSDEERVAQILLNLLANAAKFTEQGGIVIEAAAGADGFASFKVRDTGIGIREADLPHIFKEFRQIDGSATRRFGGTGLGLAICRRLASLLGGEIAVHSKLGEGSEFTLRVPLRLPWAKGESATPREPGSRRAAEDRSGGGADDGDDGARRPRKREPVVLLAEDDPVAAMQVGSALAAAGYRVESRDNGEAALLAVERFRPDALILDLMMPGMSGFDVVERLRRIPAVAELPVMVLTAKDLDASERVRLAQAGVSAIIRKGDIDKKQLLDCVGSMVASDPPAGAALPARAEATDPGNRRGSVVLVVEDNADNLLTVQAILDSIDCPHISAADGAEAVEAADRWRPRVIVMDMQLPRMSGLEAARAIKSNPRLAGTPIVAVTARAMKGDKEEILAAGCDAYLAKPIDPAELIRLVRELSEDGKST